MERRKGEDDGFVLIVLFIEIFGQAERRGEERCRVALRVGRRRDIFPELAAGERRVEGRRKDRQQRRQHQKGPRNKTAMETGLTQNESPNTSVSMFHI